MKKLILISSVILFASCSTYQKQQKKFVKFASDYPSELARLCSDRFPTVPEFIKGKPDTINKTVFIKGDSIPCPDGSKVKAPDVKVDCPETIRQVDTIRLPDNAKIYLLNKTIQDLQLSIDAKNNILRQKDVEIKNNEDKISELKKKLLDRFWIIIGLSVIMGIAIILRIKNII